jgi:uncharacterized spore protein YtfJ
VNSEANSPASAIGGVCFSCLEGLKMSMSAEDAKIVEPRGVGSGKGVSPSPENFLVFRIQTCIVVHILHRKIRNKLNISIGAGLKHHSMSWREMMM